MQKYVKIAKAKSRPNENGYKLIRNTFPQRKAKSIGKRCAHISVLHAAICPNRPPLKHLCPDCATPCPRDVNVTECMESVCSFPGEWCCVCLCVDDDSRVPCSETASKAALQKVQAGLGT